MDKVVRINRDGSIEVMNVDGITFTRTGRDVRSYFTEEQLRKEFGANLIENNCDSWKLW